MTIRALSAIAAAAVFLTACGGGGDTSSTEPAKAQAQPEEKTSAVAAAKMVEGAYRFDDGPWQDVVVEDRDGWAYWQGDIILGRTADLVAAKKASAEERDRARAQGLYVTNSGRWPNGVVAYEHAQLTGSTRALANAAMRHIALNTPIRFSRDLGYASYRDRPFPSHDMVAFSHTYVEGLAGESAIGRVGGVQPLRLNPNELKDFTNGVGSTAHEIVHALGGWHEHARADRDLNVTVLTDKIIPDQLHNFTIHSSDGAMHGPYDYCSVMHYAMEAFPRVKGTNTLIPKGNVACTIPAADGSSTGNFFQPGQRYGLSSGDINMLKYLYANAPAGRPIVDAGPDQYHSAYTGVNVQLDGSASMAVPGATIVKYEWRPLGWEPCFRSWECPNPVANRNSARASVYVERNGDRWETTTAKYQLIVTDNFGRTMSDVVTVTIGQ